MQPAAFQEFLTQNSIYPGNLPPPLKTSQPNYYYHQTPSLTRAKLYQDYHHFEKPKAQKGKSLGSAFPRRSSDYVDFSNMISRDQKQKMEQKFLAAAEKPTCSVKPPNFNCIQEVGSRTAASCENISSAQAWNFNNEHGATCMMTHKKKKSKFFPKLIPKFLRKRNKSKHEQEVDDIFIAHPQFEFGRGRSRTINCDSMEQL